MSISYQPHLIGLFVLPLLLWQILWLDNNDETYILSVDGTHCKIQEPKHPILSRDPAYFYSKFHGPALNYELGLSIYRDQIVWINGPFPAGTHDITVYRNNGLRDRIPPGKLIIAVPSSYDDDNLKMFKRRARSRHETLNRRIKIYKCTSNCFVHSIQKHRMVFEAVCVLVQYQIESESPLFAV